MPVGTSSFITDPKNNVGNVAPAGNVVVGETFPIIMASYHMSITAGSGGTQLPNVPCQKVELQNLSGNGVMWWGGNPPHAPFSGRGNELFPMDAGLGLGDKTIYISNTNQICICAAFSGQMISFIAYGNGQNTTIDPGTQGSNPDVVPPLLSSTTPSSPPPVLYNQVITWTFSEPMDPTTMTTSGLYIVTSGQTSPSTLGHLGGTVSYTVGGTTATFTPNSGQYLLNNWYVPMADAQLATSVDDADGNPISGSPTLVAVSGSPFQVQAAPGILSWAPLSGVINQAFNQAVVVTFISGTMDPATVNTSGLYIVISGQATPTTTGHLSGAISFMSGNTTATITVNSGQYALSGWYVPMAAATMADFAGAQIGSTVSGSPFQIIGPPIVSGWFPLSGSTGASGLITISPQFSTNMLASTINTSGIFVVISGQTTPLTAGHFSGNVSLSNSDSTLGQLSVNSGQLVVSTWYIPCVASGCTDTFGNAVGQTISGAFKTAASFPGDTTPPIVSGATPVSGATAVNTSGVQTLVFSKQMLSGTIVNASFVLRDTSSPANVSMQTVSLQSDLITVTMKPTAGLTTGHGFAFNISGATDLNSNNMTSFSGSSFQTELALVVSGTSPVSGATNVDIGTSIPITVSKAYTSGTVSNTTVQLKDIQAGTVNVPGTTFMQDTQTIIFNPTSFLTLSHLHRVEVSGIKDLDGNLMTPHSGATFTTQAPVIVSSTNPASGATNVAISPTIIATFSRAINNIFTSTFLVVDGSGNSVAGTVSLNSNNVKTTFTPTGNLAYNSVYTYQISGNQDLALESFQTPFSGAKFTTIQPALTQFFNVTSANSSQDSSTKMYGGNTIRAGEKAATSQSSLIPRVIKQAQFTLQRVGNPSGGDNTLYCRVRDTNQTIQTTLGSIPVTSLSTSFTAYTFTNLNATFAIATGTRVNVEFSGGNSSNYVNTLRNGNQPAGQSNVTFYAYYNTSEHSQNNTDIGACIFWY